jgi:hypothetical protein
MVAEIAKQSYRGVLCMSCRQPIPLPEIVIRMEVLADANATGTSQESRGHVFSLRCRACNREKPYRSSDVVEFEGAPRPRASIFRNPRGVDRKAHGLSRAASG